MSETEAALRTTPDTRALDAWLVGTAGGDRTAFESLYRATSSRLFAICVRVLHDRDEAQDVLQDVYTTIWNKAAMFDPERASAPAWLAMIARNKAIDRLRARPAGAAGEDEAIDVADPGASPQHHAEIASERRRLDVCIEELEPQRRNLIREAFFSGCTYEELARRGNSPLGSVKSWIRRGLAQLRACLER